MSGEVELGERRAELEALSVVYDEKGRFLEELRVSVEQFQQRYSFEVGQKQIELNKLNAELKVFISRKYNVYDGKPKRSGAEEQVARVETLVPDLKEVKKLYRKIAAIIHPDKSADCSCRAFRTELMVALNKAFARKDSVAMQRILEQWRESPEAVLGDDLIAERERINRAIAQIKRRILDIERESSQISSSDMYRMMVKVQEAEKAGRDIMSEMTVNLNTKIEQAKNTLLMRMYG